MEVIREYTRICKPQQLSIPFDRGISPYVFEEETRLLKTEMSVEAAKRQRLRDLDCFIMDNSIRESTVGELRGHTQSSMR